MQHHSLSLTSSALDHSTTSTPLKRSFNNRCVTFSRKANLGIAVRHGHIYIYIYIMHINIYYWPFQAEIEIPNIVALFDKQLQIVKPALDHCL